MKLIPILLLSIILAKSNLTFGQNNTEIEAQMDQDYFTYNNDDRNYTMGFYLSVSSYVFDSCWHFRKAQNALTYIEKRVNKNYSSPSFGNNTISFYFGGFTPDSIGTQSIIYGDRPFSNVACITHGVKFSIQKETDKVLKGTNIKKMRFKMNSFNFAFGMIGSPWAQKLQGRIHSTNNPYYKDTVANITPLYPYGWKNQISNGGGITGLLQFGSNFLITTHYLSRLHEGNTNKNGWTNHVNKKMNFFQEHVELKVGYQLMTGYYNNVQLNSDIRIGIINPFNWTNNWTTNSSANNFINGPSKLGKAKKFELFLFGNVKGNLMFYNSLLRGQMFDFLTLGNTSNYTLSANEVEPFFLNATAGVALRIGGLFLSYAPISLRTSELRTIDYYKRNHQWGELRLILQFENKRKYYENLLQ